MHYLNTINIFYTYTNTKKVKILANLISQKGIEKNRKRKRNNRIWLSRFPLDLFDSVQLLRRDTNKNKFFFITVIIILTTSINFLTNKKIKNTIMSSLPIVLVTGATGEIIIIFL